MLDDDLQVFRKQALEDVAIHCQLAPVIQQALLSGDYDNPDLNPAISRFAKKIDSAACQISEQDHQELLQSGLQQEEIFEIIVCVSNGAAERALAIFLGDLDQAFEEKYEGVSKNVA